MSSKNRALKCIKNGKLFEARVLVTDFDLLSVLNWATKPYA